MPWPAPSCCCRSRRFWWHNDILRPLSPAFPNSPCSPTSHSPEYDFSCQFTALGAPSFITPALLVLMRPRADAVNQADYNHSRNTCPGNKSAFYYYEFLLLTSSGRREWGETQAPSAQLECKWESLLPFLFLSVSDLAAVDQDYHQIKIRIPWPMVFRVAHSHKQPLAPPWGRH